jgi:hypothetical protein
MIRAAVVFTVLAGASLCGVAQAYRVRPHTMRIRPMGGTDSLTISAAPTKVSFNLVRNGVATGSSGVTITTTWSFSGQPTRLNLYGYFSSSTAALSDGASPANLIPTSAVLGQVTTGVPTTYTAFTQTVPFGAAGAGLQLITENHTLGHNSSRSDVLNLEINLSGLPNLPPGTYSGTLTLQATMN